MPTASALNRLLDQESASRLSDGLLLGAVAYHHDDLAFAELVRRHGAMVLGVCRRILGQPADAEDAFQATFLVLARKARRLVEHPRLGGWLHNVARRTALHAHKQRRRRQQRLESLGEVPTTGTTPETVELGPILDAEIGRLPAWQREAVVRCLLLGETQADAAAKLGIPEGTLSSRLARARQQLQARLTRRGITVSAGGLSATLSRELLGQTVNVFRVFGVAGSTAGLPAGVASLTQGVLLMFQLSKIKLAVGGLLLVATVGWGLHRGIAQSEQPAALGPVANRHPAQPPTAAGPDAAKPEPRPLREFAFDLDKVEGEGRKMRAEMFNLALQILLFRLGEIDQGRASLTVLDQPLDQLVSAGNLVYRHREYIELLEAVLAVRMKIEEAAKVQFQSGTVSRLDVWQARYKRLELEHEIRGRIARLENPRSRKPQRENPGRNPAQPPE